MIGWEKIYLENCDLGQAFSLHHRFPEGIAVYIDQLI
jgi:hypothetical protein